MNINDFKLIAENSYSDIIEHATVVRSNRLTINLCEGSFVNIWFSQNRQNRYSYHWDRKNIDGTIYRHDNSA